MSTTLWILWGAAITAAMVSCRVSTLGLRGGMEQQGGLGILQSLAFPAVIALMIPPFYALSFFAALATSLAGSFFNPVMLAQGFIRGGERAAFPVLYTALPALNLAAVAGAIFFIVRMVQYRGYGWL